jgi:hypothetical protein
VRRARITRAWCGLRTTIYAYGPNEDALSREHQLRAGSMQLAGDGCAHAARGARDQYHFVVQRLSHAVSL